MGDENPGRVPDEDYAVTSIRMRRSVKRRAKLFAVERGKTLQEVIEKALEEYLERHSMK